MSNWLLLGFCRTCLIVVGIANEFSLQLLIGIDDQVVVHADFIGVGMSLSEHIAAIKQEEIHVLRVHSTVRNS